MDITVDLFPPKNPHFFVTVHVSEKEIVSFDNTSRGQGIHKQIFVGRDEHTHVSATWDSVRIRDGAVISHHPVTWTHTGKLDIVNGNVWETVWAHPMDEEVHERVRAFSKLVCTHFRDLDEHRDAVRDFEEWLARAIPAIEAEVPPPHS